MYRLIGFIKVINPTVAVTEKFSKREFIVTDSSNATYPQDIPFQLSQDNCSKLDGFAVGQEVEITFGLKGRMWTSPSGEEKCFGTNDCFKIDALSKAAAPILQKPKAAVVEDDGDLPF
jgi:hypothetical protein